MDGSIRTTRGRGDENPRRAQITRGQGLFNEVKPGGRSCNGCHTSANDGTNVNDALFDIGTASAAARTSGLPLYTFRKRDTGELRQLTDAGRGNVTGAWSDLGRFKTPTLRSLPARAPYRRHSRGRDSPLRSAPRFRLHGEPASRPGGIPESPVNPRRRTIIRAADRLWMPAVDYV